MTQDKDRDLHRAAQCWCDPRVSNREMDSELAAVFAEALRSVREEAVRDSKQQIDRLEKEKRELIEALEKIARNTARQKGDSLPLQTQLDIKKFHKGDEREST